MVDFNRGGNPLGHQFPEDDFALTWIERSVLVADSAARAGAVPGAIFGRTGAR